MPDLIHQFILRSAQVTPDAPALVFKAQSFSYARLLYEVNSATNALLNLGIGPGERVAVYLPKQPETVFSLFGAASAVACFVPINPLLKPRQLAHILPHCNVRVLITSVPRAETLLAVKETPRVWSCPIATWWPDGVDGLSTAPRRCPSDRAQQGHWPGGGSVAVEPTQGAALPPGNSRH